MVRLESVGMRLAKRSGLRKAKVAGARKLAVDPAPHGIDGTGFNWSTKKAMVPRIRRYGAPATAGKDVPAGTMAV
jgi:hypothetical protein